MTPFDPLLIKQVLMNLIENAVIYNLAGAASNFRPLSRMLNFLSSTQTLVLGLFQEMSRIFDKFVRGPAAIGGTGLGLTIFPDNHKFPRWQNLG